MTVLRWSVRDELPDDLAVYGNVVPLTPADRDALAAIVDDAQAWHIGELDRPCYHCRHHAPHSRQLMVHGDTCADCGACGLRAELDR